MRYTAVIFDLDGTLVDSAPDIIDALTQSLIAEGIALPVDLDASWIGPPIAEILRNPPFLLGEIGVANVTRRFRSLYDNSEMRRTVPYKGVDETIRSLVAAGLKIAVATNKPDFPTRRILNSCFSDFEIDSVSVDSVPGVKATKTQMVSTLLDRHGLVSEKTIVVGDGIQDMKAAKNLGCQAIGVLYGYGTKEELEKAGADFCVRHMEAVKDFVFS